MNIILRSFLYATLLCATSTMQAAPSPLHYAAENGLIDNLKMMLSLKCFDVNGKNNKDLTPIHLATQHNHVDCVQELITHGANVNAIETQEGLTPLHTAISINNPEIVQILLKHDADVNTTIMHTTTSQECSICGATALHLAFRLNHVECARVILDHNPNVFAMDCFSETPLHVAVRYGSIDCINLLMEHLAQKKAYIINEYGYADNKQLIAEETNIDVTSSTGCTPLHYAAFKGCIEAAKILINHGANVHARNKRNHTPRDAALITGQEIATILQAKEEVTPQNLAEAVSRLAFAQYFERYLS
ncbi:ankyrin repeat domain-containing protein [bacterium]|nr:MAG: ankyrin repeat domain-containing protein [bacterium]